MKISLLSCNIGGIDQIHAPCKQTIPYDYHYFTENNLPFPLPNLDSRMKGKYLKFNYWNNLDCDIGIWIDGSIEIINGTFIEAVLNELQGKDIIAHYHAERYSPLSELNYIRKEIQKGSPYLIRRYGGQPIEAEIDFYKERPKTALYKASFFAFWNNLKMRSLLREVWDLTLKFTSLDQTGFSFKIDDCIVKTDFSDQLFIRHKH